MSSGSPGTTSPPHPLTGLPDRLSDRRRRAAYAARPASDSRSRAGGSDGGHVAALVGEVPVPPRGIPEPVEHLGPQGVGLDDLVDDEVGREPLEVDVLLVLRPACRDEGSRASGPSEASTSAMVLA